MDSTEEHNDRMILWNSNSVNSTNAASPLLPLCVIQAWNAALMDSTEEVNEIMTLWNSSSVKSTNAASPERSKDRGNMWWTVFFEGTVKKWTELKTASVLTMSFSLSRAAFCVHKDVYM